MRTFSSAWGVCRALRRRARRVSAFVPATVLLACLLAAALSGPSPAARRNARDEGMFAAAPQADYAGSAACRDCHEREYAHWSGGTKARFVRRADAPPPPGDPSGDVWRDIDWTRAPVDRERVLLVVGLRRRLAFVARGWTVFGQEYRLDTHTWQPRKGWRGQDYRMRCGPCHLTGVDRDGLAFRELGVGCEACHGPGGRHCASAAAADIGVPGRAGSDPALATCCRCHNDRNRHDRAIQGWAGPYHPL
ncbi:MAG: hypothetical protein H0S85_04850 [Desulfovibrionaceae bacterium]|jgi:hypothetical protein|nr:hypothetical protein [Desulfovibrionaceae bacterium]